MDTIPDHGEEWVEVCKCIGNGSHVLEIGSVKRSNVLTLYRMTKAYGSAMGTTMK